MQPLISRHAIKPPQAAMDQWYLPHTNANDEESRPHHPGVLPRLLVPCVAAVAVAVGIGVAVPDKAPTRRLGRMHVIRSLPPPPSVGPRGCAVAVPAFAFAGWARLAAVGSRACFTGFSSLGSVASCG